MEMLTQSERDQLAKRLDELKKNRPVISNRIAEARELGDLKENAEYHSAREQQGMEEAEIRRLDERLANSQVVESGLDKAAAVVFLGSTVKLKDLKTGEEDIYRLVGESTGDLDSDIIEVTSSSPMGEALIKARIGETVRVKAPRGVKSFEVIELI
ncbi:MAG: transcription elongation factor GreA [Planctomycetota bacterium]